MAGRKQGISILVVMQGEYERERIAGLLRKAVSAVFTAADGREGLRSYRDNHPDVVFTDIVLPVLDGPDMIAMIRGEDEDMPFIVAYDQYNPKALLNVLELNIDAFLRLPADPSKLLDAVRRCARAVYLRRKLAQADRMLWNLLDAFPGMALLELKGQVVYANQRMAAYLGYPSFDHFRAGGARIADRILRLNGEEYTGGPSGWITAIVEDQLDRDAVVHLDNPGNPSGRPGVFAVTFATFQNTPLRLFSFQDISELEDEKDLLADEASTDPLTKAMNRRSFLRLLGTEIIVGRPFSLVMFDIDHFKSINDEYGHDVGDAVLREISQLVRENIRETDRLVRWGGEEFMVLAPASDMDRVRQVAERLRQAVEDFSFSGVPRTVTSSFGIVEYVRGESQDEFIKRVDEALYRAKETGRNRVMEG
ncbi:sensor domain-containing diguanylate cyclase [Salidesulfovibrio onnuriiensis]|uniref:sensor domain-containing diguanylate cyclase n=1 Tax=Salidesulfovibrio onnuriiensis TaxID=2583823 RepID=UPI0011C8D50D|nr:diguanylate cyclase [Salidesulfovibrio onnuriiensis]